MPETVDRDAGGKRVFAIHQPVSEIEAIIVTILWFLGKLRKKSGDATGDLLARIVIFAALHDEALPRFWQIRHYEGNGRIFTDRLLLGHQFVFFSFEIDQLLWGIRIDPRNP